MDKKRGFFKPLFLFSPKKLQGRTLSNDDYGGHMEIYTVAWLAAGVGILAYFIYSTFIKK